MISRLFGSYLVNEGKLTASDLEKVIDAQKKVRVKLGIIAVSEKMMSKKQADEVGMSMSDYVRSLIFGNEKVVLLSEGAEIAKAMFLIHTDLEYFRSSGGIPEESLRAITAAFNDVSTKLDAIAENLTDIHAESEEADSDE